MAHNGSSQRGCLCLLAIFLLWLTVSVTNGLPLGTAHIDVDKENDSMTPDVYTPEVLSTEVETPNLKSSEVLTPNVFSPEVLSPEALSPDVLSPGEKLQEIPATEDRVFEDDLSPEELALQQEAFNKGEDGPFQPVPMPTDFRSYDMLPRDGYVTLEELIEVTGAKENVDLAFEASDVDGDGRLTKVEFNAAPWALQGDPDTTEGAPDKTEGQDDLVPEADL